MKPIFLFFSIIGTVICLTIAYFCFKNKEKTGLWLGFTALSVCFINVFYTVSIIVDNYFQLALYSNLYSISLILAIGCLLNIVRFMTERVYSKQEKMLSYGLFCWMIIDCIILLINPFKEIACSFKQLSGGGYEIVKYPLFKMHLLLSYILILICLYELIKKTYSVPKTYRNYYSNPLLGIFIIFFVNCIYLYSPVILSLEVMKSHDFSVFGYTIILVMFYWNLFRFKDYTMKNIYRKWIVNHINEGVIVFDYNNNPVIHNYQFLKISNTQKVYPLERYVDYFKLNIHDFDRYDLAFQVYIQSGSTRVPVNLQYHPIMENDSITGKLFVLSQPDFRLDELTGFDLLDYFLKSVEDSESSFIFNNLSVSIFDINSLSSINNLYGMTKGDEVINQLTMIMRSVFPENTHFIRGKEAQLLAISYNQTKEILDGYCEKISKEFSELKTSRIDYSCEYVTIINTDNKTTKELIYEAEKTLSAKKVLSLSSLRSENLNSLIKVLEETDTTTTQHVIRTRLLGERLGKRLGFSELQLSRLSLLCLIHDIGKIGVPLEILNKPTRPDPKEWELIKSHVQKGYQIVSSIESVRDLADEVLYHHERWDGKGYPKGLSKEAIPVLSRVISIVDAFDAMVNDRVYHKAITYQAALTEILKCAGTQFDPSIAKEFIQMLKEDGFEIMEMNSDKKPLSITQSSEQLIDTSTVMVQQIGFTRFIINSCKIIVEVDENFEQMLGYTKDDIKAGLSQLSLLPSEDREGYNQMVHEYFKKDTNIALFEHRVILKNGSTKFFLCSGRNFYDSITHEAKTEIVLADIVGSNSALLLANIEKEKYSEKERIWENKYRHEPLTGLLNREAFKSDVDYQLLKNDTNTLFMYIDINKFKSINDTYGHIAGDDCLIALANTLKKALRNLDVSCRMGGDEFACALFFPKNVAKEKMIERAHVIFDQINHTLSLLECNASISMGVVVQNDNLNSYNSLYKEADKLLYKAKTSEEHFCY